MIYFATRNDAVMDAVQVAKDVVADVALNGVTEEELRDAKDNLTGSYPLRFDSNGKIAGHLMGLQISGLPNDYHLTRNDLVEAVSNEDIKRVAKRLLGDFNPLLVVAGKPENFTPSRTWDAEEIF
jgi:Predicted Zn-dependent peptidases